MRDIKIGPYGDGPTELEDIVIEQQDQVIIEGLEAYRQRIRITLAHLQGEWFLDRDQGTLSDEVLGGKGTKYQEIALQLIGDAIRSDVETVDIISIGGTFDNRNRRYSVKFEVTTIHGATTEGVTL